MRAIILIAFAFSGAAALIYEVTWTRALVLVLGSTTYALSTMLGTFMAGLAIGGFVGGRLADRKKNLLMLFGLMELGIGLFGVITIPLINSLPPVYYKIYKLFHLSPGIYFFFQFLLCAGIMLVPTTLMGATFPVVSKRITPELKEMGRDVGMAYSFNTFGAILGSIAAGFLLIPLVGVRAATLTAASLNVVVAMAMLIMSKARMKGIVVAVLVVALSVPVVAASAKRDEATPMNYFTAGSFENYEQYKKGSYGDILFNRDFVEGRVKLWRMYGSFLILQIGAKIEGTSPGDLSNTHLLSYLPIAAHRDPKSFLLIGLGSGVTLNAAKQNLSDISLVEINRGVIEAIGRYGPPGLLDGVDITVQDARNFLLLNDRKYDIISSEPSYPTEAAAANLFTKEFFELAASRLNPGGIYCQWLPNYALRDDDVKMMLKTYGSAFKYVYLYRVPVSLDLIMLGSNEPFALSPEKLAEKVQSVDKSGVKLDFVLAADPSQVRQIIRDNPDIPLNTDDRPLLEFHAARNFLTGVKD